MRISGNVNIDFVSTIKAATNSSSANESIAKQGSNATKETINRPAEQVQNLQYFENNSNEMKSKVKEVVGKLNDILEVTNNTSKFMYHEGLHRYYVMVVDRETEEVVKEIPPKELLDAFYEMQKMLGMVVDEKI